MSSQWDTFEVGDIAIPWFIVDASRYTAVSVFGAVIGMRFLTEAILTNLCSPTAQQQPVLAAPVGMDTCTYVRGEANAAILALAGIGIVFAAIALVLPRLPEVDE